MAQRIVVLTGDGGSREDGNVYYSRYVIVSSDHLQFDEPIFADDDFGPRSFAAGDPNGEVFETDDQRYASAIQILSDLGYVVEEPDCTFMEFKNG